MAAPNQGQPAGAKPDYLDKGLESVQKKYGGQYFKDPNKTRSFNEKLTDKARGMFEKATG
ncbi:MAG: hypothetical protein M1817_004323 [Caeruleum heppii]|nr:MAG: hypothetical protein M1817_004323 [Caeruleum heppii]